MIKQPTNIIYLTGKPGVGKYTIAKELANKQSFIICDNQLINNPIFELMQYDGYGNISDFAWDSIAKIRDAVFEFLTKTKENSYILTNCLAETEGDRKLYEQVRKMAEERESLFIPVQLQITKEEHLKRITRSERRERWKSVDPKDTEDHGELLAISHANFLELEISNLSAEEAAINIMDHVNRLK